MTKHRKALKNAALPPFPNTWPASLCSRGSCHTGLRAASRTQQPQNLCTFCSQCLEGSLSRSPHGAAFPSPLPLHLCSDVPPQRGSTGPIGSHPHPWTLCPSICFLTVPLPLDSEPLEDRVLVCLIHQHIPRAWYRVWAQQE